MPRCFGASGFVRASRIAKSQRCAFDVQTFCPLTTNSSPSRSAAGREVREVAPGRRLAEQLAPRFVGAQERTQVPRPLGFASVAQQHRADHADRRRDEAGAHAEARPAPRRRSRPARASRRARHTPRARRCRPSRPRTIRVATRDRHRIARGRSSPLPAGRARGGACSSSHARTSARNRSSGCTGPSQHTSGHV